MEDGGVWTGTSGVAELLLGGSQGSGGSAGGRVCPARAKVSNSYLIQLSAKINSPATRSLRGRARVTTLHDIQRGSKKGSSCTVIDIFI